jgi:hypothetical protein
MIPKTKYLFIDESGNFDFSKKGTRYFILTAILAEDTYGLQHDLLELKLKLADQFEHYLEYFHATEDKQFVRDKVFKIISERLPNIEIYSVVIEKRKLYAMLQHEHRLYYKVFSWLSEYIYECIRSSTFDKLVIYTDTLPITKKRESVEHALKEHLSEKITDRKVEIYHHDSRSNFMLQVVDYVGWAIYIKHERNKIKTLRSYSELYQDGHISF